MAWPKDTVDGFEDFVTKIGKLTPDGTTFREEYWFRGQSDASWALETSLMRSSRKLELTDEVLTDLESVARKAFRSTAHLHVKPELLAKLRTIPCWWALMQHHGAPTRLLDWSLSLRRSLFRRPARRNRSPRGHLDFLQQEVAGLFRGKQSR